MLHKTNRDNVKKYSFVTKTKFYGGVFTIYYEKDGVEKSKRLPYRASAKQLINCIEKIKKDIGYYEEKQIRDIKVREAVAKDSGAIFEI